MKMILKVLTNGRVISAIVSALGAIVSACCAGCRLMVGEMTIKDFDASIHGFNNSVSNLVEEISR